MNRTIKNILAFFAAFVTVICIAKVFENWLDQRIEDKYRSGDYTQAINAENENLTKEKGNIAVSNAIGNDNLILLGSSELDSTVPQNPMFMFPNDDLPKDVTLVGHAYMQDLIHSMKVGSKEFQGLDNVAIVISLQWFMGEDIDANGFAANFSELQFYDTLDNPAVSKESKRKICERTIQLLEAVQGYDDIKVYAELYVSDSALGKGFLTVLNPYYAAKKWSLNIKDKWETYQLLCDVDNKDSKSDVKEIDWKEEALKAEEAGKEACTDNEFYVSDWYYDEYLRDIIDELEGDSKDVTFESREMEDYELFLQICKENDVKPYLIFMNTNGLYYDYIGVDQKKRNDLYDKLEAKAKEYNMDCLRLSDYEYEPYFMADVMHLGWKGWLKVDEEITNYFKSK